MSQTRIGKRFETLRKEKRVALIGYLTAGDPSPDRTPALVAALERGGADLIELGVPFSDPIADGPVIQRGSSRALAAGTTVRRVLDLAAEIRRHSEIPLILFTYLNPILRHGLDCVAREAAASGIDGCLITDLSVDSAENFVGPLRDANIDTVFLAATTSTPARLQRVAESSRGFVYLVSRTGVTGERAEVSAGVEPLVQAMRERTDLPLAVGFGVSTPAQVHAVSRVADGVVIGSALVRTIEENATSAGLEQRLEGAMRKLAGGLLEKV